MENMIVLDVSYKGDFYFGVFRRSWLNLLEAPLAHVRRKRVVTRVARKEDENVIYVDLFGLDFSQPAVCCFNSRWPPRECKFNHMVSVAATPVLVVRRICCC